jgi:hypothetical protein
MGKTESCRAALARIPNLSAAQSAAIVAELQREGLLDASRAVHAAAASDRCLTPVEVVRANADNAIRVKRVTAEAARLGYRIEPNQKISLFDLDEATRGKDVRARMDLKKNLAALCLIP